MYLDEKTSGEALPDLGTLRVDRILMLADEIEHPNHGWGFDMSSPCGTVCCIGGHCHLMFGEYNAHTLNWTNNARKHIGLSLEDANALFMPHNWHSDKSLSDRPRAARVLRHLAATGKVDWSV